MLAVDDVKRLADEEMKVILGPDGRLRRITKLMDPAEAYGEYIGATLIDPAAAAPLADALEATWRRDPRCTTRTATRNSSTAAGKSRWRPIGEVDVGRGGQPRRPAPGPGDRGPLLSFRATPRS